MKSLSFHRRLFIICLPAALSSTAHGQTTGIVSQTPLATELVAPPTDETKTVTQSEFAQATIQLVPLLTRLQEWRETARGNGSPASWTPFSGARVQIGKQSLPDNSFLGATATPAIGAQWNRVSIGSTAPLVSLDAALRGADELLDGQAPNFDQSRLSWINARALQSKTVELDLLAASGGRDLTPNQENEKSIIGGDWLGASGHWNLDSDWKLSGEWMRSQLDNGSDAAAWQAALAGPVAHPFGVANFQAKRREVQDGFAAWRDGSSQSGTSEEEVSLQQEVALGNLTGAARVELGQKNWPGQSGETSNTTLKSAANWRWKLSPSLALTGAHQRRDAWRELPAIYDGADSSSAVLLENETGAEWKLSSSLSLSASAGSARAQSALAWDARDTHQPFELRDEDRFSWSLRHRTGGGSWQLQMTRAASSDPFDDDAINQSGALRLEAERQLFSWLKLKGGLDRDETQNLGDLAAAEQWRRRAEANLSLSDWGRLSLRYGDSWRPGATPEAGREYGVGYQIGQGAGLGLSMEYSRRLENLRREDEQWRVGLTYR